MGRIGKDVCVDRVSVVINVQVGILCAEGAVIDRLDSVGDDHLRNVRIGEATCGDICDGIRQEESRKPCQSARRTDVDADDLSPVDILGDQKFVGQSDLLIIQLARIIRIRFAEDIYAGVLVIVGILFISRSVYRSIQRIDRVYSGEDRLVCV